MKARYKCLLFLTAFVICILNVGCTSKETTFDFEEDTEVRLYTAGDQDIREFINESEAKEVIQPVAEITWERDKKAASNSKDYEYRIQSYTIKGEKSKNIKITSDGGIIYNNYYWVPEGEVNLDLSYYAEYFKED
ncbi:MAG: hypothetical protein II699_06775 [Lachnospiraceae bacterium]|nr:hypothetical protein [Lachnospiraceae bacterium]